MEGTLPFRAELKAASQWTGCPTLPGCSASLAIGPPEHCRRLMTGMAMCSLGETPRDAIPGKHQGCIKVVPRDLGNIFTGTSDGRAQGLLQEVKAIELEGNKPDFATCYSSNGHSLNGTARVTMGRPCIEQCPYSRGT